MAGDSRIWRRNAALRRVYMPEGMTMPEWVDEIAGALSPEKQLWLAVLLDAVALCGPGRGRKHDQAHIEAVAWIANDDEWVGSFVFVCDVLHLTPSAVRRAIERASVQTASAPHWWMRWWGHVQEQLRVAA